VNILVRLPPVTFFGSKIQVPDVILKRLSQKQYIRFDHQVKLSALKMLLPTFASQSNAMEGSVERTTIPQKAYLTPDLSMTCGHKPVESSGFPQND
jgi:hypothetical protein